MKSNHSNLFFLDLLSSFGETTSDVLITGITEKSFCAVGHITTYKDNFDENKMQFHQINLAEIINHKTNEIFEDGQTDNECSAISNVGRTFKRERRECIGIYQSVHEFNQSPSYSKIFFGFQIIK